MLSKFKWNAIISGHIDLFCLVCERHFDSEEAANSHIDDEEHEQRLLQHPYLDKYRGDHIRKVNKSYFCEFCSVILTGAVMVNLHVAQKSHSINKGYFLLKRVGSVIIAFDNILINEKAWHSFADEACAICGTEFEDESLHKMESGHLLKLVLTKVDFDANNSIYRKIDDSFFQCVTCNTVCTLESLGEHFAGAVHKNLYAKCEEEMKIYSKQNKLTHTTTATKKKSKVKKPKNSIEIIPENGTSNKVPSEVDENQNNTETSIDVAITKPNETIAIETYAKENNLTLNLGNSNAYCRFCETEMPSTLNDMGEHVTRKEHKLKMAKVAQAAAQKFEPKIDESPSSTKKNPDAKRPKDSKETTLENITSSANKLPTKVDEVQNITETAIDVAIPKPNETKAITYKNDMSNKAIVVKQSEDTQSDDEATAYAKEHNLIYNPGIGNANCRLCETKVPSNLRSMKQHVTGKEHKLKMAKAAQKLKPKLMRAYVENLVRMNAHNFQNNLNKSSYLEEPVDAVVNGEMCMPAMGWFMVTKISNGYRCQICEVNIQEFEVNDHNDSDKHHRKMQNTPVITSLKLEFIREARPNIYHCGFCNLVIGNWSSVDAHLQSREHAALRREYQRRLRQYLPAVEEEHARRIIQNIAEFSRMLFHHL